MQVVRLSNVAPQRIGAHQVTGCPGVRNAAKPASIGVVRSGFETQSAPRAISAASVRISSRLQRTWSAARQARQQGGWPARGQRSPGWRRPGITCALRDAAPSVQGACRRCPAADGMRGSSQR